MYGKRWAFVRVLPGFVHNVSESSLTAFFLGVHAWLLVHLEQKVKHHQAVHSGSVKQTLSWDLFMVGLFDPSHGDGVLKDKDVLLTLFC